MAPGGGRGGLGWLILAAALAVPGFLFYNWWSHLKAERDHSISAKAGKLAAGAVFQTPSPAAGRLVNPMTPSTAAPAGLPPGAAPVVRAPGAAVAMTGGAVPPASAAVSGTPAPAVPGAPAAMTPPAAPPVSAVILSSASTVVLPRDPMMSPLDLVRLQEKALEEEERQRQLENAKHPQVVHHAVKKESPIERHIELQGIVAKADGDNLAIINGSTYNPGETFTVEHYSGKVKVVRITSSEVTLEYNKRKFKLSVNAE